MSWTFFRRDPPSEIGAGVAKWAQAECAPWADSEGDPGLRSSAFARFNDQIPTVFIYDLGPEGARMRPKTGIYEPGVLVGLPQARRGEMYLDYLDAVCKGRLLSDITIAIDVDDLCPEWVDFPIFTFQKPVGTRNILLPDIDFLVSEFYKTQDFWCIPDNIKYKQKERKAVFVGSTTGIKVIKKEDILNNNIPRIRAARFFRNSSEVEFLLTNIVQVDSEVERALLRDEGYGQGNIHWRDQINKRFILSMDGNGATCSRVYVGLISNSCLLKYSSDYVLYYFRGLRGWQHYIPIFKDADVHDTLAQERANPDRFENIAKCGRHFAERYLSRKAVDLYTLKLLQAYAGTIYPLIEGRS